MCPCLLYCCHLEIEVTAVSVVNVVSVGVVLQYKTSQSDQRSGEGLRTDHLQLQRPLLVVEVGRTVTVGARLQPRQLEVILDNLVLLQPEVRTVRQRSYSYLNISPHLLLLNVRENNCLELVLPLSDDRLILPPGSLGCRHLRDLPTNKFPSVIAADFQREVGVTDCGGGRVGRLGHLLDDLQDVGGGVGAWAGGEGPEGEGR